MNSLTETDINCLIDLSQESLSTINKTSMDSVVSLPPITTDEMIVKPLGRMSIDNNPFDTAEKQAKMYDDPFEIQHAWLTPLKSLNHQITVPMGSLIEVDEDNGSQSVHLNSLDYLSSVCSNSPELNFEPEMADQISSICVDGFSENSLDPLNQGMMTTTTTTSINTNKSYLPISPLGKRNRVQSDPDSTRLTKRKMDLGKSRSTSLDQLFLKNQFLKKLSNSPLANGKGETNLENSVCLDEISLIQKLANSSTHSACDDLMSTKPEWIDSENEDSDIESMTIPFLKNIKIAKADDVGTHTNRDNIIEKLSKYKKNASCCTDDNEEKIDIVDVESNGEQVMDTQSKTNLSSMIDTLRDVVNKCGDEKSKGEASAVLDNLNMFLSNCAQNSPVVMNNSEPTPIIRQRTFSMDGQLSQHNLDQVPSINGVAETLPDASRVLTDNSKSTITEPKRKSFSGSIPLTPTSSRLNRSLSHQGASVVQPNPQNRRSSICSTSSRLMRRSSISIPIETKSSPSVQTNRQSLISPRKEPSPTLPKPVSRKTIMKPSHPLPRSSNISSKSLKLRVGEQTKPGGPLKAVIPYENISSLNRNVLSSNQSVTNVSADMKKRIATSTPILFSSVRTKSGLPTSSSTPVNDSVEKAPARSVRLAPNKNRLSYVPTTPKSNLKSRPFATEKKKNVTFDGETDKMSTSMITGCSLNTKQLSIPTAAIQRRRLSRSLGTDKENGVLQKK